MNNIMVLLLIGIPTTQELMKIDFHFLNPWMLSILGITTILKKITCKGDLLYVFNHIKKTSE